MEENVFLQLETIESVMAGIGRFSVESFHTNCLPLLNLPAEILSGEGQIELTKAIAIACRLRAASESSAVPEAIAQRKISSIKHREKIFCCITPVNHA